MNSTHSINVPCCITDENVAVVVHDVYTVGVVVIVGVIIIIPPVCLKHVEKNDKASDHNSLSVQDAFQGRQVPANRPATG